MEKRSSYRAYLLRCWQEGKTEWRFRLQNVQTGEQTGFTNLEAMFAFLHDLLESGDGDPAALDETNPQAVHIEDDNVPKNENL